MDALQELLAREEVRELKARYCRLLDTKEWASFADLFTEDAVMDVAEDTGLAPIHGREAMLEQVMRATVSAKASHFVHSPEISFEGPDAANVIWAMHDRLVWEEGKSPIPPATAITGYGHYRERYVRREGRWWIAALKLTRTNVEIEQ